MFIHTEYSSQDTSILQWSTRDTTIQINTRSCLHPKGDEGTRGVCIKLPRAIDGQRQSSRDVNRPPASSSLTNQAPTLVWWTLDPSKSKLRDQLVESL